MFNCLIVEDDFAFGMNLKIQVETLGIKVIEIVSTTEKAQALLTDNHIDIILSDIKLENGEFAYEFFKEQKLEIPVIFFSAYKEDEIYKKSQEANPYIFLTKPFDKLTLDSAIRGALRDKMDAQQKGGEIERTEQAVFVRNKGKLIPIVPTEVQYVRSEGNYCYIHFSQKRIAIRSSLKNILEKLNTDALLQVHRAYLVNTYYIKKVDIGENEVQVGNLKIPIGRKYKKELISKVFH